MKGKNVMENEDPKSLLEWLSILVASLTRSNEELETRVKCLEQVPRTTRRKLARLHRTRPRQAAQTRWLH